MKSHVKSSLMRVLVMGLLVSVVAGCTFTKKHEQEAQKKAQEQGLSQVEKSRFDGTFVAPGVDFAKYKKLLVEQLDMENVEILKSSSRNFTRDTPWTLKPADKAYYQERYTEALIKNLVADGTYVTSVAASDDVLVIKSRILQIAPLASKDDSDGRPGIMKVYSEGMGTMTIEMSLYDSITGKAVGIITDKRDLGRIWEENNRVTNNIQVRLAFDAWLRKLRTELDNLSGR
ncbi:DUF3313 family protein [Cellvibrio japonicus]|uniref:Putative lipoprotein n=1 Tax=Cellvibrio japonicus (strain Ueda107) TaxID=498211 RepID=B3PLH4_CELJU|nr:DUF3313 family protein [Cellvibrio japonicus]ACE85761.1 putative lipoprotein [Cellvibrio japonicus Ueda107]QEI12964.1 DUF3313 domain-containing protein [Cellvibrio japonicus]QEI16538.1 DUF3313 domain-containing protein [Cellvibrio japonicus]QEI20116.1 DUF3313 domain-containing protein [Cellvibrio japonicus]